MAALMESISFASISSETDLLAVTDTVDDDRILISCKRKTLDIYKVSDQKPVTSWSLRHGVTLTSPVVWETSQQRFITVINNQDVKLWNKETTDFEKAKKKHSSTKIHQVLVVPDYDAVLLYSDGAVGFLDNIKEDHGKGPLTEEDSIQWCQAVVIQSALCVLYVTQSSNSDLLHLHTSWYYKDSGTWQSSMSAHTSPTGAVLCSCASLQEAPDAVHVYFLWSNGSLIHQSVSQGSFGEPSQSQTILGVHGNSSMVMLDSTHIAIAGVTDNKEDGVSIYDIKFGLQQTWQPLPEKPKLKTKIFCVQGNLFVPCRRTLYAYKYDCRPSTVVSLLEQTQKSEQTTNRQKLPVHIGWDAHKKRGNHLTETSKGVAELFAKAADKSLTYAKFKATFSDIAGELKKIENHHWLMSSHMTTLLQRIMGETKCWPKEEVRQLIEMRAIPLSVLGEFIDCLVQHTEVAMVNQVINSLSNIPEKCLCKALAFYMQCDEEKIQSQMEDIEETKDEEENICPLSSHRAVLVNSILSLPYSDVFLLECLRNVSFKHALKLLEYLSYLLQTRSAVQDSNSTTQNQGPSLTQVVDWLCLLLDGHMTQFVLSPDSHVTLVKLHTVVTEQVVFFDGLVSLEALLEQLKAKSSIPQDKKVGQYCIEVLHVF